MFPSPLRLFALLLFIFTIAASAAPAAKGATSCGAATAPSSAADCSDSEPAETSGDSLVHRGSERQRSHIELEEDEEEDGEAM
mmetsp:Transcript_4195/g.9369  ORF Transcript_4195/g.9369 Transcript_4195/m.9369 type:complete len:83 (+) Transcript_4195:97-345(+)